MLLLRESLGLRPLHGLSLRSIHSTRILFNKDPFRELENSPRRQIDPLKPQQLKQQKLNSKADAIISKLPKSFQKYGKRLVNAPFSHLTSFIILHEFTAIAPLFGLWYIFHHYGFIPADVPSWMLVKGSSVIESILGDTVSDLSLQERTRLIIEGATAYGIVKATFPIRVVFSLFMTPWLARVFVEPGLTGLQKLFLMIRGKK